MSTLTFSIEIELPDDVSDEYLDAMVEDLTHDQHIDRLKSLIKHWARLITGEACHIAIDWD
jgi:hypothetical protein